MTRFEQHETSLAGLTVIERLPIGDERGFLERMFCAEDLAGICEDRPIVQINRTSTASAGIVRGMHFQFPPHSEMKLVSCLRGQVFDVAIDLRAGSPTFLDWHAEVLSAENHRTLVIPEGFAHGFQTLTEDCELLYLHTAAYQPSAEGGLDALDPALGIEWPLPVAERSARDQGHPRLTPEFAGVRP